jgi:hypothetical protein
LQELGRKPGWNRDIPHIQSLVINQRDRLPGSGFEGFLADRVKGYHNFSPAEKRAYLDGYWHDIFAYPRWNEVLNTCGLAPRRPKQRTLLTRQNRAFGGGGEGPEHKALKEFVRDNPSVVGLPNGFSLRHR